MFQTSTCKGIFSTHVFVLINPHAALSIIIISIGRNANFEDELRDIKTKQQTIEGNYNFKHSSSTIMQSRKYQCPKMYTFVICKIISTCATKCIFVQILMYSFDM